MKTFNISEDKRTITLPVPLGSTIYTFVTNCDSICYTKEDVMTGAPKDIKACSHRSACHVRYIGVHNITLSFDNIGMIMAGWGTEYFENPDDARDAGVALVKDNQERLNKYLSEKGQV